MATAFILGATGLIGQSLLHYALDESHYKQVFVLVRTELPIKHEKLVQIVDDFQSKEKLESILQPYSFDDVYCCLGTTIKKAGSRSAFRYVDVELPLFFAQHFQAKGMRTFTIVSAIGTKSNSLFFYSQMKAELEQRLSMLGIDNLFIFRPSLLLGNRMEFRLGERLAFFLDALFSRLFIGKLKNYRAVEANSVALMMLTKVVRNSYKKDNNSGQIVVYENHMVHQFIEETRLIEKHQ
jgi:uncharacterized protein YbjT (DUF2867 family)